MKSEFESPFGYVKPPADKREMCRYCYNEDTRRIIDSEELKPFEEYHKGNPFKAFSCHCCNARWHWRID